MTAGRKMHEQFGGEVVERLAALAVDMALDSQTAASPIQTHMTRTPTRLIEETRDVLTDAGFDARVYHREAVAKRKEAMRR